MHTTDAQLMSLVDIVRDGIVAAEIDASGDALNEEVHVTTIVSVGNSVKYSSTLPSLQHVGTTLQATLMILERAALAERMAQIDAQIGSTPDFAESRAEGMEPKKKKSKNKKR